MKHIYKAIKKATADAINEWLLYRCYKKIARKLDQAFIVIRLIQNQDKKTNELDIKIGQAYRAANALLYYYKRYIKKGIPMPDEQEVSDE